MSLRRRRAVPSAPVPATSARGLALLRPSSWSPQRLLLAAGVALLLVAAAVFVGIAWTRIGVLGQCSLLLLTTGGAVVVSRTLAGRGLGTSSEAVAVLALGLGALDLWAAHRLGLLGLDRISSEQYDVTAVTAVGVLAGTAGRWVRTSLAYPLGAVLGAALLPLAALDAVDASFTGTSVAGAAAVLVGAAASVVLVRARPAVRAAVLVAAAGWATVGTLAGLVEGYFEAGPDGGALALGALAATAAGLMLLARTPRLPSVVGRTARYLGAAVVVGTTVVSVHHQGMLALTALAVAAAVMAGMLALRGVVGQGAYAAAWAAGLAAELEPSVHLVAAQRSSWLAAVSVAAGAGALRSHGRRRTVLAGAGGPSGVAAVAALVDSRPVVIQIGALVLVTVVFAVLAGWRLAEPEEPALGCAAVVGAAVALRYAVGEVSPAVPLSVVLASAGLLALGYAALPSRGLLSIAGVVLCSAATWVLSLDASIDAVEVYTLPLAALALAVGAVRWRRYPDAASWTTVGPALSAALLPSAVAATSDAGLVRPLLVLLPAVVATLAGTVLRWQAPVVTGALAALVVACSQLAPYAVGLPRWLSLGMAGAVLLALGTRYEQRRAAARRTGEWLTALR